MSSSPIYPDGPAGSARLTLAIVQDGLIQPRWISLVLEAIAESGAGRIGAVIRLMPRQPHHADGLAYRLYARADGAHFARSEGDGRALEPCDLTPLIGEAPAIELAPTADNECEPDQLARLRDHAFDVILHLAPSPPPSGLSSAARYGLWRYCPGDGSRYGGGPPMFWELFDGHPATGVRLQQILPGADRPRIIRRGSASTQRQSLFLNRQKPHLMAVPYVARALRDLQRRGPVAMAAWCEETDPADQPEDRPTNLDVLRLMTKVLSRWLRLRWDNRKGEWWFIALRLRPPASPEHGKAAAGLGDFRPLPVPAGHIHADPFLFERDGLTHLFFEDMDATGKRGVISHCQLDAEGRAAPPEIVLERPYHLSYPFVFTWGDDIFMIPETGQNNAIELYRAEDFPRRWVFDRRLLDGWRATDATLHCDEQGHWWMFAAIDECGGGTWNELFLFHAETPLGPWQPHPGNPVDCDVRHARPGGRLFRRDGKLIRPAQDCATHYGSGLWLMEVVELNKERYRERPLRRLGPEWLPGNHCLHHLDSTDRFEVIDGMRLQPGNP